MPNCMSEQPVFNIEFPWSIGRLILYLILYLIGVVTYSYLCGLLLVHLGPFFEWNVTTLDLIYIGQTHIYLTVVLGSFVLIKWWCKRVGLSIKLIWGSGISQVRFIILAIALGTFLTFIWAQELNHQTRLPTETLFYSSVVGMGFVGPLVEELYFRGILYRVLRKRFHTIAAILISATIFAVYHIHYWLDIVSIVFVWTYGVITAYFVERTNSLTASFVFHIITNSTHIVVSRYYEILIL